MITKAGSRRFDLNRGLSIFLRPWEAGFSSAPRAKIGFAGFLSLLCLIPLLVGPIIQFAYAHDAFIFLDGAWRVLSGQRPQVDFSTNLGPLTFLYTAAGIALTKHGGYALVVAHVLMAATIAALAYWISVRRLTIVPAVGLSGALVLLALAPYNVGEAPFALTFGMMYNRFGYSLLGILLIEIATSPRPGQNERREELAGGTLAGFVCAFLLFLKITYFLVGVGLIIALLRYRRQNRARFVGILIGGLALTVPMLAYLRFDMPALAREYRMAAGGKHMGRIGPFELAIANVEPTIFLVVVVTLFAWLFASVNRETLRLSRPWAILVTATLGFALVITNHQFTGEPLNAFLCLLIAGELAAWWPGWRRQATLVLPASLVLIALCAPMVGLVLPAGIAYALPIVSPVFEWQRTSAEMRLDAPAVSDFRSKDEAPRLDRNDNGISGNYAIFVNDGLKLLRENSKQDESVMTLEFSNPFSFSLQRVPPHGGTTCLQFGVTFDDRHRLSADQLFGDAKLAMLPKRFTPPLLADAVARLYEPELRRRYQVVAESSQWTLLRRMD